MTFIKKIIQACEQYWVAITVLLFSAITFLSLWPLPELPKVPGTDKIHHFIAYATLVFPAAFVRPRLLAAIVCFCIFWGGFIELVQPYVNRHGEWLDMAANTAGVFIGLTLGRLASALVVKYLSDE